MLCFRGHQDVHAKLHLGADGNQILGVHSLDGVGWGGELALTRMMPYVKIVRFEENIQGRGTGAVTLASH